MRYQLTRFKIKKKKQLIMKNLKILIIFCVLLSSYNSIAQDSIQVPRIIDKSSFGIGGGFDFGGLGANILVYPGRSVGLFGGVGYALGGIGLNAGAKFRMISKKHHTDPYAIIMYGYNAAIKVKNASQFNKLFYGPSFGFGLDFHPKQMKRSYYSIALLVPIRSSEVKNYMDDLENNHGVEFTNELPPIAFSIGYRFILN